MIKAKFAMIWVLLFFFLQETNLVYQGGYESLIEYASENSESREEYLHHQVIKSEAKKKTTIKDRPLKFQDSQTYHTLAYPVLSVKRTILYRSLII